MTRQQVVRRFLTMPLLGALVLALGCGGGSSSPTPTPPQTITPTAANVQAITVNVGPEEASVNAAFVSATVCFPGSATNCVTINNLLVDTGSVGLRVVGSALGALVLPQATVNGNPLAECYPFVSGNVWGPVQTADVQISGELAHSVPIHVLDDAFSAIPAACSSPTDTEASLGFNGFLGVGSTPNDCGSLCTGNIPAADVYYQCPAAGCQVTGTTISQQVQNPVSLFPTDNNGVIVELPAVTSPQTSITGSLVFGIGTESNNGLNGASVISIDPAALTFTTNFENTNMPGSYIDSGSTGLFFDSNSSSLPECQIASSNFYCPTTSVNLTAVNSGAGGGSASASFTVFNADTLAAAANSGDAVLPGLGAPSDGTFTIFDWGLPFFFGRNVYTSIEGTTAPGGTTPYFAYLAN